MIIGCIITNTVLMALVHYRQPDQLTLALDILNYVFAGIFTIEMILKLSAYGFFRYISDGFNVFDGLIVILRSVSTTVFKYCNIFEILILPEKRAKTERGGPFDNI